MVLHTGKWLRVNKSLLTCLFRYTGHKNSDYKIDNCLNSKDTYVMSGSEDGHVYIWDLLEVGLHSLLTLSVCETLMKGG